MDDLILRFVGFVGILAGIFGAGFAFTMCAFYLPIEYKKGNRFLCFVYISAALAGLALFLRSFS